MNTTATYIGCSAYTVKGTCAEPSVAFVLHGQEKLPRCMDCLRHALACRKGARVLWFDGVEVPPAMRVADEAP